MIKKVIGSEYINWNNKKMRTSKNDLPCSISITNKIDLLNVYKLHNLFLWRTNGYIHRDNNLIALMYKNDVIRYKKYNELYKYNGYTIYSNFTYGKPYCKKYLFISGVCCKLLKEILYFND